MENFKDALRSDGDMFAKFHQKMLDRGFYFACSQFETGFISTAITNEMIDECLVAVKEVMSEMNNG